MGPWAYCPRKGQEKGALWGAITILGLFALTVAVCYFFPSLFLAK